MPKPLTGVIALKVQRQQGQETHGPKYLSPDEAACTLLAAIANVWVREALLNPRHYSDRLDKRGVARSHEQALVDFSSAVVNPANSWVVETVARVRNMPQRTILNALLDRAGLPHDYKYTPPTELEQAA